MQMNLLDLMSGDPNYLNALNCAEGYLLASESFGRTAFPMNILHDVVMDKQTKLVTLTEDKRSALQAICRQRKVDALEWKRCPAVSLLLDAGYESQTREILNIVLYYG